eukprot:CAMPEP_0119113064 /NCGR_PEP_ID=MMETSP1180-20130426/42652_1 /TAXON_ID=3052 ORGANISM="Chlamydomonas cf sp, Strain CCMP681" /NCGR_SAMPLE_ID=MMETSP1180 /ASSEMBLY_ACC=CAM_ASM_000741 /LENGTH=226 /DNA_ID=CAMNT_0007100905 /DNA_START=1 /DNA_END=681 /DNA_ORIENTATION=-
MMQVSSPDTASTSDDDDKHPPPSNGGNGSGSDHLVTSKQLAEQGSQSRTSASIPTASRSISSIALSNQDQTLPPQLRPQPWTCSLAHQLPHPSIKVQGVTQPQGPSLILNQTPVLHQYHSQRQSPMQQDFSTVHVISRQAMQQAQHTAVTSQSHILSSASTKTQQVISAVRIQHTGQQARRQAPQIVRTVSRGHLQPFMQTLMTQLRRPHVVVGQFLARLGALVAL